MGIKMINNTNYTLEEIQVIVVDYLKKSNVDFEKATNISNKIVNEIKAGLNDLPSN
jgi:hypothetical protein